jgi:ABC-2 type transport system permease protein
MRYRFDFIMTFVCSLTFGLLFYMVWKAIYFYSDTQLMPWSQLITYIMVGQAFNFARWSPADRTTVYSVAYRIRSGDVALDLIRPIDFQIRRFLESLGFFAVEMMWVSIPALFIFIFVFGIELPGNFLSSIGFLFSLIMAFIVSFGLNSIVMMLSFWTTNAQGVQIAKRAVVDILAGTLIPFEFFPEWLKVIVKFLPFQGIAHTPLSIYSGQLSGNEMVSALIGQAGWAVLMVVISRLLWLKAAKQLTINGG